MTRDTLFLRALAGAETERRPLWIMRQAGRYLPEYRELRSKHGFADLMADPELAAHVTLMPIARYPLDAAIVFADIMSPVAALGIDFHFAPGPVIDDPLRSAAQIRALPEPDPGAIAPEVMATLARVKRELPPDRALIGFAGAPLTLAAYLVEGQGKKDFPTLRAFMAEEPVLAGELLDRLARLAAAYLIRQAEAGADVIQVFDSWGGLFAHRQWERQVRPHLETLLTEVGRAGVPRIIFCHGAPHLVEAYAELPAEALAVDWRTDLATLRQTLGPDRALQGNLDPAVLLAGPDATRRETRALLAHVPARGHIVNLGHGILPTTPLESVEALIEAVHEEVRSDA